MISINIGCGRNHKGDAIGIDQFMLPGVGLVADLERGLPFIRDDSVDEVICEHFLEHIDNFESMMGEMHRVCKVGGTIRIAVPHFSNPYYYSDYTHKRFFGLYSFDYFVPRKMQKLKRKVPDFYSQLRFDVIERQVVFSSRVKIRNWLKKRFESVVNSGRSWQEYYEESLCWIVPCYEIRFVLRPIKGETDVCRPSKPS